MSYLLLGLLGVVGIFLAARREPTTTLVPTYAVAMTTIGLADWLCFGWFDLYAYHPGLIAKPLADGSLAEFLAEFLFVPSLTILLLTYTTVGVSIVVGTAVVTAIEFLFSRQGTFTHQGWQLWLTTAAFPVYFGITAWYWKRLHSRIPLSARWRNFTKLCILFSLLGPFNLTLRATQAINMNLHIAATHNANQSIGRFLIFALVELPAGYWVLAGSTPTVRLQRTGIAACIQGVVCWGLSATGWHTFIPPYNVLWGSLILAILVYLADSVYHSTIDNPERNPIH